MTCGGGVGEATREVVGAGVGPETAPSGREAGGYSRSAQPVPDSGLAAVDARRLPAAVRARGCRSRGTRLAWFGRHLDRHAPGRDRASGSAAPGRVRAGMPVLAWRRDQVGEPVEEFVRREVDDALGVGCGRLARASGPDPGAALVAGQRVADALWPAGHGGSRRSQSGGGRRRRRASAARMAAIHRTTRRPRRGAVARSRRGRWRSRP